MQYTTVRYVPHGDPSLNDFAPGRGLSHACLNLPDALNPDDPSFQTVQDPYIGSDCYLEGELYSPSLLNSSDYAKILVNESKVNTIVSKSEGSLIVPASPLANMDFEATTFGSSTSCEVITDLCDIESVYLSDADESTIKSYITYECRSDKAGLDLSGNFDYDRMDPVTLVYYRNATMSVVQSTLIANGPKQWFALVMSVDLDFVPDPATVQAIRDEWQSKSVSNTSITPVFGLVQSGRAKVSGILSCTNTLSDVVRVS